MPAAIVERLTTALQPWADTYASSKPLETAVTALHLGAMLLGGGLAVSADRATLKAGRAARDARDARARVLADLEGSHTWVLASLAAMFASGLLLAAADVETFLSSPAFWVKLGLVALLLANGVVLGLTERALRAAAASAAADAPTRADALWGRLRASAVASLTLWLATLVAGVALVNAA